MSDRIELPHKLLNSNTLLILFACVLVVAIYGSTLLSLTWQNAGFVSMNHVSAGKTSQPGRRTYLQPLGSLHRALNLRSDNESAQRGMGIALTLQGDEEEANSVWREIDSSAEDLLGFGEKSRKIGKMDEALMWYQQGKDVEPHVGDWYFYEGLTFVGMERPDEALRSLESGLVLTLNDIGRSDIYYQIGKVTASSNNPPGVETALAAYNSAIAEDDFTDEKRAIEAHYERAELLRTMGRVEEAFEDYEWVTVHDRMHYGAHVRLGIQYRHLENDAKMAEALFSRAISLRPNNKWAYQLLAELFQETGRRSEAISLYEQVLQIDPEDDLAAEQIAILRNKDN